MLKENQNQAITMILAGKKMNEIATEIGVARETLWKWRKSDSEFIASYNREKNLIAFELHESITGLVQKAIKVLSDGMTSKEALEILRLAFGNDLTNCVKESQDVDASEIDKKNYELKMGELIFSYQKEGKSIEDVKELIDFKNLSGYQKNIFKQTWERTSILKPLYI